MHMTHTTTTVKLYQVDVVILLECLEEQGKSKLLEWNEEKSNAQQDLHTNNMQETAHVCYIQVAACTQGTY